jgi:hypothetical protein
MYGWLPEGERTRQVFISLVLAGCVVLGVIRFLVVPGVFGSHPPSLAGVLDATLGDVIATALAATALGWLLLKLLPPPSRPAIVENVPAHEIDGLLASALPAAKRWWYDGSTGRYQRATTLPEMGQLGRLEGGRREVRILILDPCDKDLCLRYAEYRQGLQSAKGQRWTLERVRGDLYATVLAALAYSRSEPLDVSVAVKRTMSSLRYDLSDSRLVITREGRSDPAISCPDGSFYYEAYRSDLLLAFAQARPVALMSAEMPAAGFDRASARAALGAMGLDTSTLQDDALVDRIIVDASSREHPYS